MDNSRKRPKWSMEAEELLLALWAQNVTKLRATRTNFYTFSKMSNKMDEMGYPFTAFEIRFKIQSLKNRYRDERRRIAEGLDSEWQLYDSVHRIVKMCNANKNAPINIEMEDVSTGDNNSQLTYSAEQYEDAHGYGYPNEDSQDNADETAVSSHREIKNEINDSDTEYLKSINTNLVLLVKTLNELTEQSLAMEAQRSASIKQLLNIFKHQIKEERSTNGDNISSNNRHNDPLFNEMRMKCENDNEDEYVDKTLRSKQTPSLDSNKIMLNKKLREEYLKTKQLERDFMTEKHKLQMEILNTELEAKRKKATLKYQP